MTMRVIALTGNIASGKTAVADMLAERGATIVDADVLSREAVRPGSPALEAIEQRWGSQVVGPDGNLDRASLRNIVFKDQLELDALNDIVHPEVLRLRDAEVEAARARGDQLVVCVIPLLFERHLANEFDSIVLVDAPRSLRLERITRDRGIEETEAMNMIASQMPADLKRARADYVIENSGTLEELSNEVDRLWDDLVGNGDYSLHTAQAR
ncbi:MAG: dephospho-CoA kinase [Gemmatimonadaceae bacterium]|nr:dephospho-CoA kinase [Gemmatimonadaceae bacterium]